MTFKEWLNKTRNSQPKEQRLGQWLFNEAPKHIQDVVRSHDHLDPFHVQTASRMYVIVNFLTLAELIWDVHDGNEIQTAKQLVLSEPNAVRN